jgi:hypothetical protein
MWAFHGTPTCQCVTQATASGTTCRIQLRDAPGMIRTCDRCLRGADRRLCRPAAPRSREDLRVAMTARPLTGDGDREKIPTVGGRERRAGDETPHRSSAGRRRGCRNLSRRGTGRSATEQRSQLLRFHEFVRPRREPWGRSERSRWSFPDSDSGNARLCQLWRERLSAGIANRRGFGAEHASRRSKKSHLKGRQARVCGAFSGAPGMIRTCDLCLRRAALYPLSYGRSGWSV